MNLFFYSIGIYLAAGIIQTVTSDRLKPWVFVSFAAPASLMAITASLQVLISGTPIKTVFAFPFPLGDVPCVMDSLAAFFVLITAVMGLTAAIYSTGYLAPYLNKKHAAGAHYLCMALLLAFILLVTVIQNALAFLIAWEIMSLSSFFLVAFENEKKEVFDAALHYLIAMHIGVIFLISAFVLLSIKSGSFDFNSFQATLNNNNRLTSLLFIFFFIGFGTKAGFFPFHVWLPKAHPAAPGHISGIMSAVMIKTGIYGILRVLTLMGTPPKILGYFVLAISLATAIMGILYAMTQRDTKGFLAYSSIENIGIMGMGMGVGMLGLSYDSQAMVVLGFGGCLVHLFNHAIFKGLLFFAVGTVYQRTHQRNMEKMGGLIRRMPYTAAFSLAGSVAICGLPPMNGFIGKFLLYFAMVKGIQVENPLLNVVSIFAIAALGFVGATALMAFAKMFSIVFLGVPREKREVSEAAPIMLVPMAFLAGLCLVFGIFPRALFFLVENPLQILSQGTPGEGLFSFFPLHAFAEISLALSIFIMLWLGLYLLRNMLLKNRPKAAGPTWGCGYTAPNPRMQYTASSFARTFLLLFNPMTRIKFKLESPDGVFAQKGKLETSFPDLVEKNIISPIQEAVHSFFRLFSWVQGGATQQYILYGLLFLAAAILWVLGVKH
ncbi:MAG: hypothetical protein MUF15_12085 [Acidobacteria bacterium]|jgi:formate hydrogenlyase subunit 3/multisubunit Na+/H+ antiporter MnhD subunit|nr:hypothetical protein [Acidobacteriota bacterium]